MEICNINHFCLVFWVTIVRISKHSDISWNTTEDQQQNWRQFHAHITMHFKLLINYWQIIAVIYLSTRQI